MLVESRRALPRGPLFQNGKKIFEMLTKLSWGVKVSKSIFQIYFVRHEDEKVYPNFSSKFHDSNNADPPVIQTSHDKLPQKEFEATPPSACFLEREDWLSGNNYLMIWININQLKPFLYTSKIRNKTKIK